MKQIILFPSVLLILVVIVVSVAYSFKTLVIVNERTGVMTSAIIFSFDTCDAVRQKTKAAFDKEMKRYVSEKGSAVKEIIMKHERLYDAMNPICVAN